MTIQVYGIANCDTVKRARAWLTEQGQPHAFHDFKKLGLPEASLLCWAEALGWQTLLNRQGTSWRKLDPAAQAGVVDTATALSLIRVQPSLIKRPLVEWADGRFSVGFKPDDWAARLAAGPA